MHGPCDRAQRVALGALNESIVVEFRSDVHWPTVHHALCDWHFHCPSPEEVVRLHVQALDTERFDVVSIFDGIVRGGATAAPRALVAPLHGNSKTRPVFSTLANATVRYVSDGAGGTSAFTLNARCASPGS